MIYSGRLGQQSEMPNWLDTYGILDYSDPFQYMPLGSRTSIIVVYHSTVITSKPVPSIGTNSIP